MDSVIIMLFMFNIILWCSIIILEYFPDITSEIKWYFSLCCALICYYTLGKSSSLTQTRQDGEIIKQIFIGY